MSGVAMKVPVPNLFNIQTTAAPGAAATTPELKWPPAGRAGNRGNRQAQMPAQQAFRLFPEDRAGLFPYRTHLP